MAEPTQQPAPPPPTPMSWTQIVDAVAEANKKLVKAGASKRVIVEKRGDGYQYRWASPTPLQSLTEAEVAKVLKGQVP